MALSDVAYLLQLEVAQDLAGLAEGLEGVLGLPGHYDIANQSQEIAFAGGIGKVPRGTKRGAKKLLAYAGVSAELRLILLQHSLMLAHLRNVTGAQVTESGILGLALVILERVEKGVMLHYGIVDLAL